MALAYPQEVTQDIIVENDIYNNNLSTINIEADKTPIAVISASEVTPVINTTVHFKSTSYSPDAPPAALTQTWYINGIIVSTALEFNYSFSELGTQNIMLIVEDEHGRKSDAQLGIKVQEKPIQQPIIYADTSQFSGEVPEAVWTPIFSVTATKAAVNASCKMDLSAGVGSSAKSPPLEFLPSSASIRAIVGGSVIYSGTMYPPANAASWQPWLHIATKTFTRTINIGDVMKVEVSWSDTDSIASLYSSCNDCINGDFQIVATPQ